MFRNSLEMERGIGSVNGIFSEEPAYVVVNGFTDGIPYMHSIEPWCKLRHEN